MKFLLDHNLPPVWAKGLKEFSARQFEPKSFTEVVALRDKFPHGTPDTEWLKLLGEEGGWAVVSADFFRSKGNAEREMIRRQGLSVFVLSKSWQNFKFWPRTAQLLHWWPEIVGQANAVQASAVEVPWKTSSKFIGLKL